MKTWKSTWKSAWKQYCKDYGITDSQSTKWDYYKAAFKYSFECGVQEGKTIAREQALVVAKKTWD